MDELKRENRARNLIIGRDKLTGQFVNCYGELSGTDDERALKTPAFSHVRRANPRRSATTQFGEPVHPPDARVLRRSFEYGAFEAQADERGLIFICFQSDIQERGFEFINNNWLMASGFMGCRDYLLAPEHRIIIPRAGCYYFCPLIAHYPGEVFFE